MARDLLHQHGLLVSPCPERDLEYGWDVEQGCGWPLQRADLIDVDAGFEIWRGGSGLATRSFYFHRARLHVGQALHGGRWTVLMHRTKSDVRRVPRPPQASSVSSADSCTSGIVSLLAMTWTSIPSAPARR